MDCTTRALVLAWLLCEPAAGAVYKFEPGAVDGWFAATDTGMSCDRVCELVDPDLECDEAKLSTATVSRTKIDQAPQSWTCDHVFQVAPANEDVAPFLRAGRSKQCGYAKAGGGSTCSESAADKYRLCACKAVHEAVNRVLNEAANAIADETADETPANDTENDTENETNETTNETDNNETEVEIANQGGRGAVLGGAVAPTLAPTVGPLESMPQDAGVATELGGASAVAGIANQYADEGIVAARGDGGSVSWQRIASIGGIVLLATLVAAVAAPKFRRVEVGTAQLWEDGEELLNADSWHSE